MTVSSHIGEDELRRAYWETIHRLLELAKLEKLTPEQMDEVDKIADEHSWDGLSCSCGGGWMTGHAGGCPEATDRRSAGLGTVTVKPLEWEPSALMKRIGFVVRVASSPFGEYQIVKGSQGLFDGFRELAQFTGSYREIEGAEAALQSDFETRVKSCLTSIGVEALPKLENCGRYLAEDNTGQWHYINHAGTWQGCPPPFPPLPQDVIDLVIASREMFDLGYDPDHAEANALDRALEAFSSRVPFENQPDDEVQS